MVKNLQLSNFSYICCFLVPTAIRKLQHEIDGQFVKLRWTKPLSVGNKGIAHNLNYFRRALSLKMLTPTYRRKEG